MIKDSNFMNEVKNVILNNNGFDDKYLTYPYSVDVSDGSSYEGFINFTDGFVDIRQPYVPFRDNELNVEKENIQKIIDSMWEEPYEDFFRDVAEENYPEFETAEDFKNWCKNYQPYKKDSTIPLFDDLPNSPLDKEHDNIYNEWLEYEDSYYDDAPAFIGVKVFLYDHENEKPTFYISSYINDDFGYGRESLGRWAKMMGIQSADGSSVGDHAVYEKEVEYDNLDDLKEKLAEEVRKAFESIDCKYIS